MKLQEYLNEKNIKDLHDLVRNIKERALPVEIVYKAAEYLNPNRDTTAAYYTDTAICDYIFKELPDFPQKNCIRILEPSVGAGSFLPFIAEKYKQKENVELCLIDIDEYELEIAELIFETYYREKYPNVTLKCFPGDYLTFQDLSGKFDLAVGNPPYAKVKDRKLLKLYKETSEVKKSVNLFVWFLEKAIRDADWVSMIVPKSVLNAPEYQEIREKISSCHISSILDFGENGFKGVKIETVNLLFTHTEPPSKTHILSLTQGIDLIREQDYITDPKYPVWLLYRNAEFDAFANSLKLGVFEAFRDRQIVGSMVSEKGKYRVLKSGNIGSDQIFDSEGYDAYMDDISNLSVSKFLNHEGVVLIPNLSYAPRACFLPQNAIANGSVALLTVKDKSILITHDDLKLFATEEFRSYYRIARNYGTRSLNIDQNSVYFFGIRR